MDTGLVVADWNQWVAEGAATPSGVVLGKLDCYLDGYRFRVCLDAGELAGEVSQRKSLLELVGVGKPDSSDENIESGYAARFTEGGSFSEDLAIPGYFPTGLAQRVINRI